MPIETSVHLADEATESRIAAGAGRVAAFPIWPGSDGPALGPGPGGLLTHAGLDPEGVFAGEQARGAAGECVAVPCATGAGTVRVLLVGVGDRSPLAYRRAGAALARAAARAETVIAEFASDFRGAPAESAGHSGDGDSGGPAGEEELRAFVEGALLASYDFSLAGVENGAERSSGLGRLELTARGGPVPAGAAGTVSVARTTARAVAFARDLVNTPSSVKTPQWLAEQARESVEQDGVRVTVRTEKELADEGFGGILAVGAGSVSEPRLVELSYAPEGTRGHVVLVGKGITFDSGGLSLKPNSNMALMKTDMAGGAVVMAVLRALRDLDVPFRVTGLVAAAENMPSGSAQRPGDVIRHYGGRTAEVLNTDAEGRLVLADALSYACARLAPDTVVDLATLTGAATVALGRTHGALYATDDVLAGELVGAGSASGDRLWQMPLVDDYRDALDSDVADVAHIARRDYGAGSVVAALFLREFVDCARWAHLDIAGPARATSAGHEITKGGTGFGVRALLRWLAG